MSNFEKLYLKNRLINVTPEQNFGVTLADFKQIIDNNFKQLKAEWFNNIVNFPGSQKNLEFLHRFYSEIAYFLKFSLFPNQRATS